MPQLGGGVPAMAHCGGSGGVVMDATSPPAVTQFTRQGASPSAAVRFAEKGLTGGARRSRCVACEMVYEKAGGGAAGGAAASCAEAKPSSATRAPGQRLSVVALDHGREVRFELALPAGKLAHAPVKRGSSSMSKPGLACPAAA